MNRNIHYIYIIAMLLLMGAATPAFAQTIKGNIYGGGQLATVTLNTDVRINSGTVDGDVYGGGALANVEGNTEVWLSGGSVMMDIYGGGLGDANTAALVLGDATVTLNGSTESGVTNDCKVYGSIFGCNNVNGTPKGHAKVHVLRTEAKGTDGEQYHVAAVYGGGNLAAYNPNLDPENGGDANQFAEVLVEKCDNSIEYVYGGGNAAPVPATKVTIIGANAIDNAFAGGNGAGTDNPGADVGYLGFFSGGSATEYGTGIASIDIKGGTIHHVYGGSNTLGYIKDHAEVNVEAERTCTMDVTELYGGGKKAPGKAATINITCTGENGRIENVYGGAHMADLTGDITLNINGGNIGNAFGGNNESGTIDGSIIVNVNWSTDDSCGKNSLTNVYGCGNKAWYSVYGYNDDGTSKNKADDQEPIAGPIVNLINGTVSGYVYGGGLGETAVVTGNPTVNLIGATVTNDIFGGGDAAPVTGNPKVNANYGSVNDIFAGGRGSTAVVTGNTLAYINKTDDKTLTINDVYGGGALADVTGDTYVSLMGGSVGSAYGGGLGKSGDDAIAAAVSGTANISLGKENVDGTFDGNCVVGNIFGCNDTYGAPAHAVVTTYSGTVNNVYGGGNQAAGNSAPVVYLVGGAIKNNVYGGGLGESAVITGDPVVNLWGATVGTWEDGDLKSGGNIFGGGEAAPVKGNPMVSTASGTAGNVYAGGFGATAVVTGNPTADIDQHAVLYADVDEYNAAKGTNLTADAFKALDNTAKTRYAEKTLTVQNVFGGGSLAGTNGATSVTVSGGTVSEDVYGGGALANVSGATTVVISGGTINNVYGGGLGSAEVAATVGNVSVRVEREGVANNVFGCNNTNGAPTGTVNVEIAGGTVNNNVYGGGNLANAEVNPIVTVSGGTITHDVYGGGALANVFGNTSVVISGGTSGDVYGGGLGSAEVAASVVNTSVRVTGGSANNVFGCNNTNGAPTGTVNVEIAGGIVNNNVYGGGNLADAIVNPIVTVSGGTVTHDVYGGGALANVTGNTTVDLFGGTIGSAYGGGLGSKTGVNGATEDVAAEVSGNTIVTLGQGVDGTKIGDTDYYSEYVSSVVTGEGIFGANNINGTPKGHVKVHVLHTADRLKPKADPEDPNEYEKYDVPAVYGGGNLSAYEPTDSKDFAEVLIENCGNSINYVYGGGNAAPVPATQVTIYGANAINYAFAGGNGYGADNPGADVGYKGYYSQTGEETPTYGSGETHIKIYGGTINHVFGGSNTLGYIRTHAYVEVLNVPNDYKGTICELHLGEVQAGGNEAEMYCGGSVSLACSEGAEVVYAGSNDADIHGDINLVITSGTYGKVFGGNNHSGNVYGGIKINIDETGCWPVMIGELYACGNKAPYSVFGYQYDSETEKYLPRTKKQYDAMTPEEKTTANMTTPYTDPEINLISFTRIGKVFGGGYGETAKLYGNTKVNVEPIKGIFAGRNDVAPSFILDGDDNRVAISAATSLPYGITKNGDNIVIPNEAGTIGSIYGGGNAGAVYGNTHVNIGLQTKNHHISGDDTTTEEDVAMTITGNVFGGGNEAIVSGNTHVQIGKEE